jgi:hypothetical protein
VWAVKGFFKINEAASDWRIKFLGLLLYIPGEKTVCK